MARPRESLAEAETYQKGRPPGPAVRQRCLSTLVLAVPSGHAELVLRCDASREAMGVALYQKDADGYLQTANSSRTVLQIVRSVGGTRQGRFGVILCRQVVSAFSIGARVPLGRHLRVGRRAQGQCINDSTGQGMCRWCVISRDTTKSKSRRLPKRVRLRQW